VAFFNVISSPNYATLVLAPLCYCAYFPIYRNHLYRDSNPGVFRGCHLCSCYLLFVTNNAGISAVLLSCLGSELQKTSSSGLEPRTVFRGCGLCFCNLLFVTNNFGLGTVLLSYPPMFSSWSQGISMLILVQIGYPFSNILRTYIHTYPQFQLDI
jgi:hypothetical protein